MSILKITGYVSFFFLFFFLVHQGLIRVCSKPVMLEVRFFKHELFPLIYVETLRRAYIFNCVFPQHKDKVSNESSEVRVGKWKVPSSRNYLPLYKTLLDCDQLKVLPCVHMFLGFFFMWFFFHQ